MGETALKLSDEQLGDLTEVTAKSEVCLKSNAMH